MNLEDYQNKVEDTWISNDHDLERIVLGICGEAGEIAEMFKKYFRGDYFINEDLKGFLKRKESLSKEIGDVLYYLAKLCNYYDLSLDDVLNKNVNKLADRKRRNKLKGSGDER